jgi:hypothetical protein
MKKAIINSALIILLMLAGANLSFAQTDKPYTDGPLWQVNFVHSKPGMGALYLKNLGEGWIKEMRAAKDAGLIMDFKVLSAQPTSENDWDLILMYEIKNHAMLDGMNDKIEALGKNVFADTDEAAHQKTLSRNELRTLQGGKLMQQLDFK